MRPMNRGSMRPGGAATPSAAVTARVTSSPSSSTAWIGSQLVAIEARIAGGLRRGNRLALVEHHRPARRHVVGDQPHAVDVRGFLHRLGDLQLVAAVAAREQAVRQQHVLARARRVVHARARRRADAADAEQVGDEREVPSVEGEQDRTARQLPFGLCDAHGARGERQLALEDAVGPGHRDEIDLRPSARADRERLQALTGPDCERYVAKRGPLRARARGDLRADARDVRSQLRAARIAAAERDRDEGEAAGSRTPHERRAAAVRRHRDQRRSARRVEHRERPAGDWGVPR